MYWYEWTLKSFWPLILNLFLYPEILCLFMNRGTTDMDITVSSAFPMQVSFIADGITSTVLPSSVIAFLSYMLSEERGVSFFDLFLLS